MSIPIVQIDNAPHTYINKSTIAGFGLYANKFFLKGEIIIDDNPFKSNYYKIKWVDLKPGQYNKNWLLPLNERYCMTMDHTNKLHYINHSRTPNCNWHIKKLVISANQDIQKDEELFIDYRLEYRPTRSKYPEWI